MLINEMKHFFFNWARRSAAIRSQLLWARFQETIKELKFTTNVYTQYELKISKAIPRPSVRF